MKISQVSLCLRVFLPVLVLAASAAEAVYLTPPTWSPMTMLNVSYDSTAQQLVVVDPSAMEIKKPGSSPASLAYAPDGTYDPAQPWRVLNGTLYSRRLGWYDPNGANTDGTALKDIVQVAYGSGASVWVESLSQSPKLKSYLAVGRYGVNANNTTTLDPAIGAYDGILGTAGSSTQWQWDWLMDHNTYAVNVTDVVAGELLSATYKVYIGDAAGNEILNGFGASTATVETWTWQASIPEPAGLGLLAAGGLFLTRRRSCALARVSACVLAALAATAFDARAVDYAPAPGWGGMVMLDVTYDPGNKSIALMPETYYFPAGSGPVLQAAGNYDPAQPWGVLNGTVYSRRLGWNDPNEGIADWQIGDLLPAGTSLWINRTGGSPELKTYAVAEYDNTKPYTPIFGTAGSDSKWQWDLFMDHNAVAVDFALLSVPNQLFTATYEVYVGDALGNPLAGYTSATTTWSWTGPAVVPEPTGLALLAAAGALVMQRRRRVHDRSV